MAREFVEVEAAELRLPSARREGADIEKLRRQIAKHGGSVVGMPPLLANRGNDGVLELMDGVTRATRVAMLNPGTTVTVEILAIVNRSFAGRRSIGASLPNVLARLQGGN